MESFPCPFCGEKIYLDEKIKRKTSLPKDFKISENVQNWAKKKGFDDLENHLENFKLACQAKGYKYIDWDRAFMNAIRNNWAKLKKKRPDWQFMPKDDKQLCEWANKHGYPSASRGMLYWQYRIKLAKCIEERVNTRS